MLKKAIPALPGIVISHAKTICLPNFHLTAHFLLTAPAPIIDPVIAWVVLAGIPNVAKIAKIIPPPVSAANP